MRGDNYPVLPREPGRGWWWMTWRWLLVFVVPMLASIITILRIGGA